MPISPLADELSRDRGLRQHTHWDLSQLHGRHESSLPKHQSRAEVNLSSDAMKYGATYVAYHGNRTLSSCLLARVCRHLCWSLEPLSHLTAENHGTLRSLVHRDGESLIMMEIKAYKVAISVAT